MKEANNFLKIGLLFTALCLIAILGFNSYLRWKEFNLSKNTVMPGRFVLMPKAGLTFLDTATGDIYHVHDAGLIVRSITKNHGREYDDKLTKAAEFPRRSFLEKIRKDTIGSGKIQKKPKLVPADKPPEF